MGVANNPDNDDDRIRRTIVDFHIDFSNVDPAWINQFPAWGLRVALQVLPESEGLPIQFEFPDVADFSDVLLHYEMVVGEYYRTTATGVEICRFPAGGGMLHIDTPAQRKPVGTDQLNIWLTWALNISHLPFDKTVLRHISTITASTLWETAVPV